MIKTTDELKEHRRAAMNLGHAYIVEAYDRCLARINELESIECAAKRCISAHKTHSVGLMAGSIEDLGNALGGTWAY